MKERIAFTTCYDTESGICGYVIAEHYNDNSGDYFEITERQYKNALKRATIVNANIHFLTDKEIRIVNKDGDIVGFGA